MAERDSKGRQRPAARVQHRGQFSSSRPGQRRRESDPARRAAWDLLRRVDAGGYANLELPRLLRAAGLSGRDAAFATELSYGTLRMQGLYDPIIELCSGRPVGTIDPPVLSTLRLGVHQLLGMRVPAHAAASETVGLARSVNGAGAAGFTNAVLRRVTERTREEWVAEVTAGREPLEALAIEHSHPLWVVRALRAAFLANGLSADSLEELLVADNTPAPVTLVARPGLAEVDELVQFGAVASEVSPVGAVLTSGDPAEIPAVRDTRAAVQDAGSQLVALALGRAEVVTRAEQEWLDLCAGPGGKSGLLAMLAHQAGAVLFANEISEHRTELVRKTLAAAIDSGAEVMIGTGDGRDIGREEPDTYDRVLLDAPCTGLGALRRRPEARWRRSPADVGSLTRLQGELLGSALDATRPGGVVAYVTCSPHLAETHQVVSELLAARDDVRQEDARPLFPGVPELGPGPAVQLWPHVHGTDAMFFALLRKVAL